MSVVVVLLIGKAGNKMLKIDVGGVKTGNKLRKVNGSIALL